MSALRNWVESAACAGLPTQAFFSSALNRTAINRAKLVCQGCPVRAQCADYGKDERFGIWGGMTPRERNSRFRYSGDWVEVLGSRRRLRALAALGYGTGHLELELKDRGITHLTRHGLQWIREGGLRTDAETADIITRLYRELSRAGINHRGRSIVARKQAAREGWPGPDAWRGMNIDDPAAQPRQVLAA